MKNTFRGAVVLAAVAALTLAGCSDPGSGSGGDSASAAWPAQDTDLSGTTLTVWAAQNSNKVPDSVVAGFEKLTGAEVEVVTIPDPYEQSIQTKVATGDKPDLAFWQPTASMLTALNASTNLQSLDDAPWLDSYKPELRDITGILDDTRYAALITTPAVEGVYYNKEVFEKAGITELPTNWDEFIAVARDLKTQGTTPFFDFGGGTPWATQWWVQVQLADAAKDGLWDEVNANEKAFTDAPIQDAINEYNDLIAEGLFNADLKTATFEEQGPALLSGEAAMAVQVNSFFGQLQSLADTAELDQKIGFFPISPSGNVGTFIPDQSNALVAFKTGDDKREAAARQLLSYWLGDGYADFVDAQATVSLQTGVDSSAEVPEALLAVSDSLADSVGSMQALAVANPDLYLNLGDMIQGTMTPDQVGEATQKQFAELAKAIGAPGF
ncbi:ABC transporter substrate-binding protein [Orlajensenia leifsoniae]|uniref:Carbohydrate ABC transporter substrate-binding protein n=1 Tax=Orlajensenia leifsoniae TaxID=2561933 RepID=A0A4Y9R0M3_9MICO|nr:ABC transporter substrate-binding protein [Leifsonia flava]TFV98239.1 carbohydrate ABC transporter substrate-binding protein [Leifsonia flava]